MKKVMVASFALLLVLGFAVTANAKKTAIINFDKGGMPNDMNCVEAALCEDHAPKGQVFLKIMTTKDFKDAWWCGEFGPKKANYDGYDVIKFDYFNEDSAPVSLAFIIKPKGSDYNTRMDVNCMLRPGKGSIEFDIAGACGNGGQPIDWKTPVGQWNLSGGALKKPIHIGNIWLATSDDGEEKGGDKGGDKKEEKKDDKKKK